MDQTASSTKGGIELPWDKSKVKVVPVEAVVHRNYSDLIGIRGHRNYYVNLLSGKITFKEGDLKISTGKRLITEAKEVVREYLAAKKSGESIEKVRRTLKGITAPLLDDLYREAIEDDKVGKKNGKEVSTVKGYWKSWNHGLKFFWGDKTTNDITDENVIKFRNAYLKEKPKRSFEHTLVHLGILFKYCLMKGYIKKLPDMSPLRTVEETVKKNKRWVKPGRVYTPEEIEAMKREALTLAKIDQVSSHGGFRLKSEHRNLLANRALLGICLGLSGLRLKEAMALEWEKMDFKKRVMHVWSFKNHKWREVPMTDEVFDALKAQKKFTGHSKFVFPMPTNPNKFLSNQNFDKVWYKVQERAEIKDWDVKNAARFHDLRHTFATMTSELGWPPKVACDVLDMSLEEYDKTYAKPGGAKKAEWMKRTWSDSKEKK